MDERTPLLRDEVSLIMII